MLQFIPEFSLLNVVVGLIGLVIILSILSITIICLLKKLQHNKKKAKFRKPKKSKLKFTEKKLTDIETECESPLLVSEKSNDSNKKSSSLVAEVLKCVSRREIQKDNRKDNQYHKDNMRKKDNKDKNKDKYKGAKDQNASPAASRTGKKWKLGKLMCNKIKSSDWLTDDEESEETERKCLSSVQDSSSKQCRFLAESSESSFEDLAERCSSKTNGKELPERQTPSISTYSKPTTGVVTRSKASTKKPVSSITNESNRDSLNEIASKQYSKANWKVVVEAKYDKKHQDYDQIEINKSDKTDAVLKSIQTVELVSDKSNVCRPKRRPALEEVELGLKSKNATEDGLCTDYKDGIKRRPERDYYKPPGASRNANLSKRGTEQPLSAVQNNTQHFKVEKLGKKETSYLLHNINGKEQQKKDSLSDNQQQTYLHDDFKINEDILQNKADLSSKLEDLNTKVPDDGRFLLNERTLLQSSASRGDSLYLEPSIDDVPLHTDKFESISTEFSKLGEYENLLANDKAIFYQKIPVVNTSDPLTSADETVPHMKQDYETVRQELFQKPRSNSQKNFESLKGDVPPSGVKTSKTTPEQEVDIICDISKIKNTDNFLSVGEKQKETEHYHVKKANVMFVGVSEPIQIDDYAAQEWKGDTVKADKIRRGYNAIKAETGYECIRRIRGDNYCAIRAVLFKTLSSGIDILTRFRVDVDMVTLPFVLLADQCDWIEEWSFAKRVEILNNSVADTLSDCISKLKHAVDESCLCTGDVEGYKIALDVMNGDPETEVKIFEAVKFLMLYRSIKLYKSMQFEDDLRMLPMLFFARDTSQTPAAFMRNHLNHVGDTAGFDQLEMMLLGHTLKIKIKVMRLDHVDEPDFIAEYSDDPQDENDESIFIVAEDDRHYNVLSEDL